MFLYFLPKLERTDIVTKDDLLDAAELTRRHLAQQFAQVIAALFAQCRILNTQSIHFGPH